MTESEYQKLREQYDRATQEREARIEGLRLQLAALVKAPVNLRETAGLINHAAALIALLEPFVAQDDQPAPDTKQASSDAAFLREVAGGNLTNWSLTRLAEIAARIEREYR